MAVTVLDKGKQFGTSSLAVTSVTAGSTLVVFAHVYDNDVYTISSDAGTFVKQVNYFCYTGQETYWVSAWVLVNAAAGTHNIALNSGGANSNRWCFEVLSADTVDSFDTNTNTTATGASITAGPITNAVANSALLSYITGQGSANYSGMSGWTLSTQGNDATYGRNCRAGYLIKAAANETSGTWDNSTSYRMLCCTLAISGSSVSTFDVSASLIEPHGGGGLMG